MEFSGSSVRVDPKSLALDAVTGEMIRGHGEGAGERPSEKAGALDSSSVRNFPLPFASIVPDWASKPERGPVKASVQGDRLKIRTAFALIVLASLLGGGSACAAENLRLNPHLDYSSDSQDGPLITGDRLDEGVARGLPNYLLIYGEGCFNSKRQARRTVHLYEKYKGRVNFVIIDLDRKQSPAQQELVGKYYRGYIPHVVVVDRSGSAVYDASGEVEEQRISALLDQALRAAP